ncbi:MAG TPA: uracil-DNA glycosylase family protein, partial [Alphaproteobacteria bacterium]|nr:uracil-DNA glycosylase family protein [Alphaproteobacteria bacterium]
YTQRFYLPIPAKQQLKLSIEKWRDYLPKCWILPHPSWHNNYLLQKKSVVMKQLIPALQERVQTIISS